MLDLWLIRHAESLGNLDGSSADTSLSPAGRAQALALRGALSGTTFNLVWSSPLLRARETASIAIPDAELSIDERLRELAAGPKTQLLDACDPDALRALLASRPGRPVESGKEFMARVTAWREALPAYGRVIAFTHFGVVRELIGSLLGFRRAPEQIGHTSIFRLQIERGAVEVIASGDDSHLRSLPGAAS